MKSISTLLAATLVAFAASSTTIYAADEQTGAAKVEKTEAAKTETHKAKKPVKKHSHMEDKTGMPMSDAKPDMHKKMPKDRHDHTKDKL